MKKVQKKLDFFHIVTIIKKQKRRLIDKKEKTIMTDLEKKLSEIDFVEPDKVQELLNKTKNAYIGDYIGDYIESIEYLIIGTNPIEIIQYGQYYWDYDNERGSQMGYSEKIEADNGIIIYYNHEDKISLEDYILSSFPAY